MAVRSKPVLKGGRVGSIKKLKASLKRGSGSSAMTRIPSEGSIVVRFLEEPTEWIEYQEFYSNETQSFYPLSEGGPVPGPGDNNPSKRFIANAVDTSDNRVIAVVLPKGLAQSLMRFYEKWSTLMDRDYELVREGTGLDTTYAAIPEPPSKMNLKRFDTLDLIEILTSMLPDDDEDDEDDEEEPPWSSKATPRSGGSRRRTPDPDDDEDDEPVRKSGGMAKRPIRKPVRR